MFNKLFGGNPELFASVVDDLILVGVLVDSVSAGGGGEEVRKEIN